MRVSRWGSPRGRCPRRNHVCHASGWNPVSLSPPWRWHPVPFSSNRRTSIAWNPFRLGPRWPRESSRETGSYRSGSKAFINRCWGHWPRHPQLLKPRRRSLLRSWKGALRDMWYRGWRRSLRWKSSDHRMLLAWSLQEERFTRYCGYPSEMARVHNGDWGYVSKGSLAR